MKIARYKNLSQVVDTENLYKNSTLLSEIFMFGNSFQTFLKLNGGDIYMSKETLDGGFSQTRIPVTSWGALITQQNLIKYYYFKKIDTNLISFKINQDQYLTILENDSGQCAIYIDTTDDIKSMRFLNTACPLTVTKEDENQTIHSFNNFNDGTNSSILYNTLIDQSNYGGVFPYKLNDVLTSSLLTPLSFNLLSTDTGGNDSLFIYAMASETVSMYSRNFDTFSKKLLNQVRTDQTFYITLTQSSLLEYLNDEISNNLSLIYFNNNSLIYYNQTDNTYLYKNIFAHHITDFDSSNIFTNPKTKFNLFKQMLNTFNGITNFDNLRISKAIISYNLFMQLESNLSLVTTTIYKTHEEQCESAQETKDVISPSTTNVTSTLTGSNSMIS